MNKYFSVFAIFTLCFVAGFSILRANTDEYFIDRDPAAVKNSFDFSHLRGERLQEAVRQRLMTGLQLKKEEGGMGIALGHFVFVDESGQKKPACQAFGKVALTFEAEGVSVGGDKPQMEVEGRCEHSSDLTMINPLFVPVAKIMGERPGDGEFQFNQGSGVTIRFANLPEAWPRMWLLKSVKLVNEKSSEALVVESDEVARYLGHPMVFNWK
jgi:hypothetical protein